MPFKDPETKREYYRKYMARKKLREMFESGFLYNGEIGRPLTEEEFEELLVDHDLEWRGKRWREELKAYFEKRYVVKEAAGELDIHPNTLRNWLKEGKVKYSQEAPYATIYIPEGEINRLKEKMGLKVAKKFNNSGLCKY